MRFLRFKDDMADEEVSVNPRHVVELRPYPDFDETGQSLYSLEIEGGHRRVMEYDGDLDAVTLYVEQMAAS